MRSKGGPKVFLAEKLQTISNGYYKDILEFDEDEYIVLNPPWNRPNKHRLERSEQSMKMEMRPANDPERIKFYAEGSVELILWCLSGEWHVKDEDGHSLPLPTKDTWEDMTPPQQGFFTAIVDEEYFKEAAAENAAKSIFDDEAEDPKSNGSSTENGASTSSRESDPTTSISSSSLSA